MSLRMHAKACVCLAAVVNFIALSCMLRPQDGQSLGRPFLVLAFEDSIVSDYKQSLAWKRYLKGAHFADSFLNIRADSTYCDRVKAYRQANPILLDERGMPESPVIYNNFPNWYFVKKVFANNYDLVLPEYVDTEVLLPVADLPVDVTMFYLMTFNFHNHLEIGTAFACEGQRYNHIPGNAFMDSKAQVIKDLLDYSEYYTERDTCFSVWDVTPRTLLLDEDLDSFVEDLLRNKDSADIRWVLKQAENSNKGEGVWAVGPELAASILEDVLVHKNSTKYEGFVAQEYVDNPFLIEGRKFDLRTYMFVASMEPLMVLYHDGFLKISITPYRKDSTDQWTHVTNVGKAKQYFTQAGFTEEQRKQTLEDTGWLFDQFEEYMVNQRHVSTTWMQDSFRKQVKQISFHVLRSNLARMPRHPGLFELFGLDFILDEHLKVKFLELNYDPGVINSNSRKEVMNTHLLQSIVDLENALEYNPSLFDEILANSGFQWIYDGRASGLERYHGLFEEKCLYSFEVSDKMCLDDWNKPQLAIEGPLPLEVKSEVDIHTYHSIILHSWKFFSGRSQENTHELHTQSQPPVVQSPAVVQIEESMEIDVPEFPPECPQYSLKRRLVSDCTHKRFRPNSIWVN